jgi:hypothetical protein
MSKRRAANVSSNKRWTRMRGDSRKSAYLAVLCNARYPTSRARAWLIVKAGAGATRKLNRRLRVDALPSLVRFESGPF